VLDIGRTLQRELARPDIDGAVVVQGTDVIEETAFAWDLLPLPAKPVIVVGAMRSASQDGYDGPANLRAALLAATDPSVGSLGVVVAMAGELHAADDVRKTHTHALDTFRSPNHGRLGTVTGAGITVERERSPVRLPSFPDAAALPVPMLTVVLDEPALAPGDPAGVVVAATGGGNTPPAYLELARSLMDRSVPVVLTTRCPSGSVLPGYAFPGGSSEWWEAGVVFSGTLAAMKARVLVALSVGAGLDASGLASMCAAWGGGRAG
jgi:L-asparaginase